MTTLSIWVCYLQELLWRQGLLLPKMHRSGAVVREQQIVHHYAGSLTSISVWSHERTHGKGNIHVYGDWTILGKGNGKMNKASTFKAVLWTKISKSSTNKSSTAHVLQTVFMCSLSTNNPVTWFLHYITCCVGGTQLLGIQHPMLWTCCQC